VDTLGIRQGAT